MPDITLGDYEIDDDSNGDLVIRDPGDTIVFRWDETNSQWNLEQQDITNLNSLETEDAISGDHRIKSNDGVVTSDYSNNRFIVDGFQDTNREGDRALVESGSDSPLTFFRPYEVRAEKSGQGNLDAYHASIVNTSDNEVGAFIANVRTGDGIGGVGDTSNSHQVWGQHLLVEHSHDVGAYGSVIDIEQNVAGSSHNNQALLIRNKGSEELKSGIFIRSAYDTEGGGGINEAIRIQETAAGNISNFILVNDGNNNTVFQLGASGELIRDNGFNNQFMATDGSRHTVQTVGSDNVHRLQAVDSSKSTGAGQTRMLQTEFHVYDEDEAAESFSVDTVNDNVDLHGSLLSSASEGTTTSDPTTDAPAGWIEYETQSGDTRYIPHYQ